MPSSVEPESEVFRSLLGKKAGEILDYLSGPPDGGRLAFFLDPCVRELRFIGEDDSFAFPTRQLGATYEYWRALPKTGGVAETERVDPHRLMGALGYLMLVDVEGDTDFRYALYGSKIADITGFDMTGKTVCEIQTIAPIRRFFVAVYMAAREACRPVYSVHEAPPSNTNSAWHRLILPLGKGGEVTRFLVCNVPMAGGKIR